jgi:hypothetical protein
LGGWKLFCDYISKEPKYEKLKNYIQKKRKANLERKLQLINKNKTRNIVDIEDLERREKKQVYKS